MLGAYTLGMIELSIEVLTGPVDLVEVFVDGLVELRPVPGEGGSDVYRHDPRDHERYVSVVVFGSRRTRVRVRWDSTLQSDVAGEQDRVLKPAPNGTGRVRLTWG